MAYSATVTMTDRGIGVDNVLVTIVETGATFSDEATVMNIPIRGIVLRRSCEITAGDADTVDPSLNRVAGGLGISDDIIEKEWNGAPALSLSDADHVEYYSSSGTLYHCSGLRGGSGTVRTEYLIKSLSG